MVLVTGATGFLGKYIVDNLLSEGFELRLLVRNKNHPNLRPYQSKVEIIEGDILDIPVLEQAFKNISYVIHAAAMVSFSKKDKQKMYQVNVTGTANIVNVSLEHGIEKFVMVSSVAALGRKKDGELINEKTKWQPSPMNSYYGVTKYYAEKEVHRAVQEGLKAVVCNPSIIIGSGNWKVGTPAFFRMVDQGLKFYPRGVNAFVAAEDVAQAIHLLMRSSLINGERFVVAAENLSYLDFFSMIARALNKPVPKYYVNPNIAYIGGAVLELITSLTGISFALTRQVALTTAYRFLYDSSLFKEKFNYTFTPISQAIESIAKEYKK